MLSYMIQRSHFALFVDPRMGKTLPTVKRIGMMSPAAESILIAGPYSCLFGWEETILRETGERVTYITGDAESKAEGLRERSRWCLTNKESHLYAPLHRVHWDVVIADESTFLKNPGSKVSKYFSRHFRSARIRGILSGTPAPEGEQEYFQQLKFLDPSIIGYKGYWDWIHDWFIQPLGAELVKSKAHKWYISLKGRERLQRQLSTNCFALKRSDVREERIERQVRKVHLPGEFREIYNKVEQEFILSLPSGEALRTIWSTQQYIWYRQIASGIVRGELIWPGKIEAVWEFLQTELRGQPVVIWAAFTDEIRYIYDIFTKRGARCVQVWGEVRPEERERRRIEFQQGRVEYFIGQPACFRHGTDLSVADTEIYFSSPTGLETRQQSRDRIVSMAKDCILYVVDFLTEKTVDESIHRGTAAKERRSDLMLRVIRDARKRQEGGV